MWNDCRPQTDYNEAGVIHRYWSSSCLVCPTSNIHFCKNLHPDKSTTHLLYLLVQLNPNSYYLRFSISTEAKIDNEVNRLKEDKSLM